MLVYTGKSNTDARKLGRVVMEAVFPSKDTRPTTVHAVAQLWTRQNGMSPCQHAEQCPKESTLTMGCLSVGVPSEIRMPEPIHVITLRFRPLDRERPEGSVFASGVDALVAGWPECLQQWVNTSGSTQVGQHRWRPLPS